MLLGKRTLKRSAKENIDYKEKAPKNKRGDKEKAKRDSLDEEEE